MYQILILVTIFISSVSCGPYDNAYLIFVGSNYSDTKNFTVNTNFNTSINGTNYFNGSLPSVLIIHGFRDKYLDESGNALVNAFLNRTGFNIIFAEWSFYAGKNDYSVLVSQLPGLADLYFALLMQIKYSGYDLKRIYPIGHSLGAHLAGRIGRLAKAQNDFLPRITGLDPAGPLFIPPTIIRILGVDVVVTPGNMLAKGNARFVDIIHTNSGGAGTALSTGDLDFWPNGGGSRQPICPRCGTGFNIFNAINCTSCSHSAAWRFYAESVINKNPSFISLRCPTGSLARTKTVCKGPATSPMGFYANNTANPGNYYVATKTTSPYTN